MPVYFSDIWKALVYNREEDPIEAYVIVPQEPPVMPENEHPGDNLDAPDFPVGASEMETSNTEKGDVSNHDSSAERASLPDDSQIGAENEQSKSDLIAIDTSFPVKHSNAIFPVMEAPNTETSNTEKGNIDNHDSSAERSIFLEDSQIGAETEQSKSDLVATDTSFLIKHSTDESPDSNGEMPRNTPQSGEGGQISSSTEEKLRKKASMFDTIATTIGFTVPILTIDFGAENIGNCPADFQIPYLVLIMGILSLFIVSYAFVISSKENFDYWTKFDDDVIFMASTLFVILWLWKNVRFYAMDLSFNSAENYCDFNFYIFNIYLDVLLGLGFVIGFCLHDLHSESRPGPSTRDDSHWMIFH